ncbi:MAG: PleD family two-component system response regulator [Candidatus Aminicenantales bacterium]
MKPKAKILLVDDDPDFLEIHKTILEKHNYQVLTATSAEEGLMRVRTDLPDLIVLDLIMEKHDAGFSFSKKVKTDPLFKKIPILMVTSVAEATGYRFSLEEDGYWMKVDDFIDKPVKPEVLLEKVSSLLKKYKE